MRVTRASIGSSGPSRRIQEGRMAPTTRVMAVSGTRTTTTCTKRTWAGRPLMSVGPMRGFLLFLGFGRTVEGSVPYETDGHGHIVRAIARKLHPFVCMGGMTASLSGGVGHRA